MSWLLMTTMHMLDYYLKWKTWDEDNLLGCKKEALLMMNIVFGQIMKVIVLT